MAQLILPANLYQKLPTFLAAMKNGGVEVSCSSWQDLVADIRERFPLLAEKILSPDNELTQGFILAINDEVIDRDDLATIHFKEKDELVVLAALAGG